MDTQDFNTPASAAGAQTAAPQSAGYVAPDLKAGLTAFGETVLSDAIDTAVTHVTRPSTLPAAELSTLVADVKPFWQSKTLISLATSGVVALAGMVGVTADPKDAAVTAVATLGVSTLGALFGAVFHAVSTKTPV